MSPKSSETRNSLGFIERYEPRKKAHPVSKAPPPEKLRDKKRSYQPGPITSRRLASFLVIFSCNDSSKNLHRKKHRSGNSRAVIKKGKVEKKGHCMTRHVSQSCWFACLLVCNSGRALKVEMLGGGGGVVETVSELTWAITSTAT